MGARKNHIETGAKKKEKKWGKIQDSQKKIPRGWGTLNTAGKQKSQPTGHLEPSRYRCCHQIISEQTPLVKPLDSLDTAHSRCFVFTPGESCSRGGGWVLHTDTGCAAAGQGRFGGGQLELGGPGRSRGSMLSMGGGGGHVAVG